MLGSSTKTISGRAITARTRILSSLIRQKATTGAPLRSGPKLGNAWAYFPTLIAARATISAEVTAPCPPLPCSLISIIPTLALFFTI